MRASSCGAASTDIMSCGVPMTHEQPILYHYVDAVAGGLRLRPDSRVYRLNCSILVYYSAISSHTATAKCGCPRPAKAHLPAKCSSRTCESSMLLTSLSSWVPRRKAISSSVHWFAKRNRRKGALDARERNNKSQYMKRTTTKKN